MNTNKTRRLRLDDYDDMLSVKDLCVFENQPDDGILIYQGSPIGRRTGGAGI